MGVKPSFVLLTGRCCRVDRTRLVVPTVRARALIELWAESGLTRLVMLAPLWNLYGLDLTLYFVRPVVQCRYVRSR